MRRPDWESRLAAYLAGEHGQPFAWGSRDCVLFAAGAIEALTGEDPAAEVRGRYATRIGALRRMKAEGAKEVGDLLDARLPRVAVGHARRGDLVLAENAGTLALGVVIGRDAVFVGESGLVRLPIGSWQAAWAV